MKINSYTPATILQTVASVTTPRLRAGISPDAAKVGPTAVGTGSLEVPQPIDPRLGNPASVGTRGEIHHPLPYVKNPLLAARLFSPGRVGSNESVNILPWHGPASVTGTRTAGDPTEAKSSFHGFNPAALRELPQVKAEVAELRKASEGVEAVMLKDIVAKMRARTGDGLLGNGMESKIQEDMLNEAIGNKLAEAGGIGIAKALARTMESIVIRKAAAVEYAKNAHPAAVR